MSNEQIFNDFDIDVPQNTSAPAKPAAAAEVQTSAIDLPEISI